MFSLGWKGRVEGRGTLSWGGRGRKGIPCAGTLSGLGRGYPFQVTQLGCTLFQEDTLPNLLSSSREHGHSDRSGLALKQREDRIGITS